MGPETPNFESLALWLDAIVDRLDQLEAQVRGLVTSQTVEAREFVLKDERARIRARLGATTHTIRPPRGGAAPDRLQTDGSLMIWVERQEFSLAGL
ncbi:MAG TPA: hypothetical protein VN648_31535 [Candidatus Methylomirabilis sp.]|nr:hypothetical protein [Candidatus Methylomirabilis sp.]